MLVPISVVNKIGLPTIKSYSMTYNGKHKCASHYRTIVRAYGVHLCMIRNKNNKKRTMNSYVGSYLANTMLSYGSEHTRDDSFTNSNCS